MNFVVLLVQVVIYIKRNCFSSVLFVYVNKVVLSFVVPQYSGHYVIDLQRNIVS